MCRFINVVFLLFSLSETSPSSASAVILKVRPGENITLSCNITPSVEVVWLLQRNNELTTIISATYTRFNKIPIAVNHNEDEKRFDMQSVLGHMYNDSLSLTILDVRESDLGLYFCGTKLEGRMSFTGAYRLTFTAVVEGASDASELCWTTLVPVCCTLALMLTLVLVLLYRRGSPSCFCRKASSNLKADADVQYASLRHNAVTRVRPKPSPDHDVTYDIISKKMSSSPRE